MLVKEKLAKKETQNSSKESGHLYATLWNMSNQHAHILHLHMRWPDFNLHWPVMVFEVTGVKPSYRHNGG